MRLQHRWILAVCTFAALFACVAVLVLMLPNKYQSGFKVALKNDRIDPMVGSDKQTQGILYVNDISEPRINTEIQLLTSSKVLREVVQRCRLGDLAKGKSEAARSDAALQTLSHELSVSPVRNSNVIEVTYDSIDPNRAAQVANAVWQAYTSASRVMHGVPGSLQFYQNLSSTYDGLLASAQANLNAFRATHNVVSLPEELTLELANASRLSSQIADSSAAEQKSSAAAAHLKTAMTTMPASVERDRRSMPNQALTQQLTSLLVALKNKRTEAAARYQPGDRLLTELDTQIEHTESELAQAGHTSADEVSIAANPAMDVARSEYVRSAAESAGARAQTVELARQMRKNRTNLATLTAESAIYKNLVQRVAEMEEISESYHKKTEEARLEQSLDEQSISNLAMLEEPYVPSIPHSPRRGLLLTLGLVWSVLIAIIVAAVAELATPRIRSPFQFGQLTGLPLLAIVPEATPAPRFASFAGLYMSMQRRAASVTVEGHS